MDAWTVSVNVADSRKNWGVDETKALIAIWGDDDIQNGLDEMYRNSEIYEEVATKMSKMGFSRNKLQCRNKIKQLKTDYKKIKDSNSKSDNARKANRYFKELDRILGHRPSFAETDISDQARNFTDEMKGPARGGAKPKEPKPIQLIRADMGDNSSDNEESDSTTPLDDSDDENQDQTKQAEENGAEGNSDDDDSRLNGSVESAGPSHDVTVEAMHAKNRRYRRQGKKRTLEDTLLQCEIERAKLEAEKLRLDINNMSERRTEERKHYELQMEVLRLKKQVLEKQL